ncbi:MAG: hypothetical protein IIC21_07915 [Chloroflexi bacterium]|nr:hypothetical protein [Chloroflexota bacterium]
MENHHGDKHEKETAEDEKGRLGEGIESLVEEVQKVVKVAIKQGASAAETIGENIKGTIHEVRYKRDNVVMVRMDVDSLKKLDDLVEAGISGSRSEAAAFLIVEGVKSRQGLFDRMADKVEEIRRAREDLRQMVDDDS